MVAALHLRDDLSAAELRALARREANGRAAARMDAVAHALDGFSRTEAARLAGMDRQALRDAVVRDNAEGVPGFYDRPKSGRPERLSAGEQAALVAIIVAAPDPERDGLSSWPLPALRRITEARFGKCFHPASLSRVVRRLDLSRKKARPVHPQADRAAQERFVKKG